ncbi:MAG TPA: low affinity iron permease family protein [Actinomycetota bacterium]|jgi:low affinity Fe/Cu permease
MSDASASTKQESSSIFDRFAGTASRFVSHAPFFVACVLLVVIWVLTYWAFPSIDTWQLVINTLTTIITFLLVALLQNSQRRTEDALQAKLDAIADGLADLMVKVGADDEEFRTDVADLRRAVGLDSPSEQTS